MGQIAVDRTTITGPTLPPPFGPYSPAVRAGGVVYVSAQAGIDPATGLRVGDFKGEARQAFHNLESVLAAAGSGLGHVVKATIFLANVDACSFVDLNRVFAEVFPTDPPARSTMICQLPRGSHIAIDCIALVDS
jgi:2-iminobutanoate/2-iminopropanoate deaminase